MITLNKAIASLNSDTGTLAPWTLDTVHNQTRNNYYHKYYKMYDGLHPTPKLRAKWAFKIVAAIGRNLGYSYPPGMKYQ